MGMFLNYQGIADNYTPNNLICSFPVGKSYTKLDPINASKPYEEYNVKGELIGYYWHYGETLNLEFNIDGEITVENDAILFYNRGQTPNGATAGKVGQRAYNILDQRSWTCVSVSDVDKQYIWEEDSEFTYDESAPKSIYISAEDYLKDKHLCVTIYNFRMEPVHTQTFNGSSKVILKITKDLSQLLKKGIYYCSLEVIDDEIRLPIFSSEDCILSVR